MEEEIKKILESIYKNVKFEISTSEFRHYEIKFTIDNRVENTYAINCIYDNYLTLETNIVLIVKEIDKIIIKKLYKKGE